MYVDKVILQSFTTNKVAHKSKGTILLPVYYFLEDFIWMVQFHIWIVLILNIQLSTILLPIKTLFKYIYLFKFIL